MQKRCAPRGLGRARVLEYLLRLHHRVQRRLRLGEARLRAEATVLGAPSRLGRFTSEHMSVESAKRSTRASQARPINASILGVILDLAQKPELPRG